MPRIFITGDTHAAFTRFSVNTFPEQKELTKEDVVIILGDFGGVWSKHEEDAYEKYWLKWLDEKNFTTVFVDGNHENFDRLLTYPEKTWNGGKVGVIRDSVLHLKRGEVFTINGLKFLALGGACSVDKHERKEGTSWWPQEEFTLEDLENANKNLIAVNDKVDYVIAHDMPLSKKTSFNFMKAGSATNWLFEEISQTIQYKTWFCGHYHHNIHFEKENLHVLYKNIIELK